MEQGDDNNAPALAAAAPPVYAAVLAGVSETQLRAVIEACAIGDGSDATDEAAVERRRCAAVNAPGVRPQEQQAAHAQAQEQHQAQHQQQQQHHQQDQQQAQQQAQQQGLPGPTLELPLAAARRLRRARLFFVLVENGADVEPVCGPLFTPLSFCIMGRKEDIAVAGVRALLRRGADARAPVGWFKPLTCTAAHLCVTHPDRDHSRPWLPRLRCLEVLVREGGAEINALDSMGLTPLAWLGNLLDRAAGGPPDDEAEGWPAALLALGADPNLCGEGIDGAPPALHWIRSVHPERQGLLVRWLRALLAGGARFSGGVFDGRGHTPLTLAAWRGLVEVVRFLLVEARVDPNEPNRLTGKLPLTCCAVLEPVIAALLAGGADARRADANGVRPLAYVIDRERWDDPPAPGAALALLRAGASTDSPRASHEKPMFLNACFVWQTDYLSDSRVRLLEELLRRTPEADRRATAEFNRAHYSAIDLLAWPEYWVGYHVPFGYPGYYVYDVDPLPGGGPVDADNVSNLPRIDAAVARTVAAHRRMVTQLVLAGAPVQEGHKAAVADVIQSCALPIAARRALRATRELAARRSDKRRWRAHDCIVQLADERGELNDADARLAATRARLVELERAVAEAEGAEVTVSGPAPASEEEEKEEEEEEEPSVVGGVGGNGKEEEEGDGDDGKGEEGGESK